MLIWILGVMEKDPEPGSSSNWPRDGRKKSRFRKDRDKVRDIHVKNDSVSKGEIACKRAEI